MLVGLEEVNVRGVGEPLSGGVEVEVRLRTPRPPCPGCGGKVWSKGDQLVELVNLPAFGRPARLGWRKRRWECPSQCCGEGSFTEQDARIAPERALLTTRAGRWATQQVGRLGRLAYHPAGWAPDAEPLERPGQSGGRRLVRACVAGAQQSCEAFPIPAHLT